MNFDTGGITSVVILIIVNIVIFIGVKHYSKKIKDESVDVMTDDYMSVGRTNQEFEQFWGFARNINCMLWIVGLAIYFGFFAMKAPDSEPEVIGADTHVEAVRYEPPTEEQIVEKSEVTETRRIEKVYDTVKTPTDRSREEFEKALNN